MSVTPATAPITAAEPAKLEFLFIERWPDPLLDRLGHDPRGRYAEKYWLGVLGPSTTLFLRLCADALDDAPGGVQLELSEVASQLGLGHKGGRNSPLARSIQRACRFGAGRAAGAGTLQLRARIAPLNRGQIERLTPDLQREHDHFVAQHNHGSSLQQTRARRLALSLIECGDGFGETESQLDRWQVPPSEAAEAVRWAWDRHIAASQTAPYAA